MNEKPRLVTQKELLEKANSIKGLGHTEAPFRWWILPTEGFTGFKFNFKWRFGKCSKK